MTKTRLDQYLAQHDFVPTRSQAESYIKLGQVDVNGQTITKPGFMVGDDSRVEFKAQEQYVSRAALKLASVAKALNIDFSNKVILDVGSSTGGFTDYALKHGALKAICVEVGTDQLHANLRNDPRIELHEQTDIRNITKLSSTVDIVVIDVSFISLREIIPHILTLIPLGTDIIAMVKPQFEASTANFKHKGVIKNDRIRRDILKAFEDWIVGRCVVVAKADSSVAGSKGNKERFYKLRKL